MTVTTSTKEGNNPENSATARPQELEDTGSSSSKKELVAASIDGDAENFSYNSKILATSEETEVGPEFDKEMKIDDVEDKDLISENVQIIKCPIPKIIEEHDIGFLMFSEETGKAIITDPLRIEIIKHGFKHFQNIEGPFLPTNNRSMNKTWFFKKLGNVHGKIEYEPYSDKLVGIVLLMENGMPNTEMYKASSAKTTEESFKYPKSNYAYTIMAQPLRNTATPYCLSIFGTNNKFTAEDVQNR
ncbi:hypothetical protein RN001_008756 [Aquatica leii]|uniref:Uncharacterized protein n=1 Tax=Aquatica leii TaxID=1421715 RepID=A0AAN7Q5D6_9COLE|nr:hypothetical protein RN001_008756 [Aquatica leii]